MSDDVGLSIGQFAGAWRFMCSRCPGHRFAGEAGLDYFFSGIPVAFFNVALVTGRPVSAAALRSHAERACTWYAGKDVPWLFVVTRDTLEPGIDVEKLLDATGLVPAMPLTGMLASQVAPNGRVPDRLQLTVPQDEAGLAAVIDLNSAAYATDLGAANAVVGRAPFWHGGVPVVGLTDGAPCTCAAVLIVDGHRYVAMVATDPGHRRRGYGEAAMRHALDVAAQRHGALPTFLHATDAGRPLYERMGYRTVSTHTAYMERRFAESH
jgi:ribosomal protein S18 acetylase RimI-like enzyme